MTVFNGDNQPDITTGMMNLSKVKNSNIIPFPKTSTWRQQANRLYDDGREEFSMVCAIARLGAQSLAFPRDNSFFALIDNMKFIETSSFEFNHAIEQIEEAYNKAYFISKRVDPSQLAEVIPFPVNEKEVTDA